MKKFTVSILIIALTMTMLNSVFADDPADAAGEDIFTLAEAQAQEASEAGAEYDGFIFKVDEAAYINAEESEGIEPIDEEAGLFTAASVGEIEEAVPGELVEYIEPDFVMELFDGDQDYQLYSAAAPNDKYYTSKQENLTEMNVPKLWEAGIEGQDLDRSMDMDNDGDPGNDPIVIAIIDSGLNVSHEDIDQSRIVGGWNVLSSTSDTTDDIGHGTFVAGEIMAIKDNAVGIAGICQNVQIMPLKAFSEKNSKTSNVVNSLRYAVEQKNAFENSGGYEGANVCVINISFGGANTNESLRESVEAAIAAGIIVVCAAGNDGNTGPIYPAMYGIGVASYDTFGNVSSFSKRLSADDGEGYENKVWVSAPGNNIISTYKGNTAYESKSGTSFSCPAVSALAAICKGIDNSLDHYGFRQVLKDSATAADSGEGNIGGQDVGFGWGKVDFVKTVEAVLGAEISQNGTDGVSNSPAANGNWYYYKNGVIDLGYNGIAPNQNGWWKVTDGKVDFGCTSVEQNEYGWWYVEGGLVRFDYTGIKPNQYGWWRIVNGGVDFGCTSVEQNEYGWWYIENGLVRFDYTGIRPNQYGWWRIVNGGVDFGCESVEENENGWWYISGGCVQFSYTGVRANQNGWWYIENGRVDFSYNGYASNEYGTWRIVNGKVEF